ncbi:hypothetical protein [Hymenobacter rigui]|uniref:DUF4468 domain-containing protein n=1 Tax=Hymenobacter rigui TaxID=334424 RepID=A0A428KM40_9BACT|nr:hypothetical protein [Hymenobacter rigui]RSK47478.1 hypothetical protein EI291_14555 [Hymenobacter rigui]
MRTRWFLFPLLLLSGLLPGIQASAQRASWPRQAGTDRIEFRGVLPWPTPLLTMAQRQALVRQWYATKLTDQLPTPLKRWSSGKTTYAGLPREASLDSVVYVSDQSGRVDSVYDRTIWRLEFQVDLVPTPVGLAYRLFDFQSIVSQYDNATSETLENMLPRYEAEHAVFCRRLQRVLTGW